MYGYSGQFTNDFVVGNTYWFTHKETGEIQSLVITGILDKRIFFKYKDKSYSCSYSYAHNKLSLTYADAKYIRNKKRYESGEFLDKHVRSERRRTIERNRPVRPNCFYAVFRNCSKSCPCNDFLHVSSDEARKRAEIIQENYSPAISPDSFAVFGD